MTTDDGRQHVTIPGTTRAGRTAILSRLSNSLTQGSGFVLVDGKADNNRYREVLASHASSAGKTCACGFPRRLGRQGSHSFNAFASGNADAIRELLASQLGSSGNDTNGVFRERAVALIGTIVPAWSGYVTIRVWRSTSRLSASRWSSAGSGSSRCKILAARDPTTGKETEIDVRQYPKKSFVRCAPIWASCPATIRAFLRISRRATNLQAARFALFDFTATFTSCRCRSEISSSRCPATSTCANRSQPPHPGGQPAGDGGLRRHAGRARQDGRGVAAGHPGPAARRAAGGHGQGNLFSASRGSGTRWYPSCLRRSRLLRDRGHGPHARDRAVNQHPAMLRDAFQEVSRACGRAWAQRRPRCSAMPISLGRCLWRTRTAPWEWIEKIVGEVEVTQATSYLVAQQGNYREGYMAEIRKVALVVWFDRRSC